MSNLIDKVDTLEKNITAMYVTLQMQIDINSKLFDNICELSKRCDHLEARTFALEYLQGDHRK